MEKSLREEHYKIVVERLRALMTEAGLDALVAFKNENFTYLNTLPSSFLGMSGWLGLAMAVVPRQGDIVGICCDFERPGLREEGMISVWRDYPMWIYVDDQFSKAGKSSPKAEKPEFFDPNLSMDVLADCLKSMGVQRGKIGAELSALQIPVWKALGKAVPEATFVDATSLFYGSRFIKTRYEIECLRHGAHQQEEVLFATMAEVEVGTSHAEILSKLRSRALAAQGIDSIRFLFVSIGHRFAPSMAPYAAHVAPGDLIKYDGALVVRGYGADSARTFIAGKPSPDQERVYRALAAAHQEALTMMGPGAIPKNIFHKAMQVVQETGLPHYVRGHVGHSVGLDQTVEEPPFLSPYSEAPMVPGNVFCLELPYYAHGFGSIMNEDMVLITGEGKEILTTRERILHPIGQGRK